MEVYCQPTSLVKQLASYERWALAIELFLGVNAAVVCALLAYMMCQGSAGSLGSFCSSVSSFEAILTFILDSYITCWGFQGFYWIILKIEERESERFL